MGDVINLRQARKDAARRRASEAAAENRARHGASKTERNASRLEMSRMRRDLDNARRAVPEDVDQSLKQVVPGDGIEPPTP